MDRSRRALFVPATDGGAVPEGSGRHEVDVLVEPDVRRAMNRLSTERFDCVVCSQALPEAEADSLRASAAKHQVECLFVGEADPAAGAERAAAVAGALAPTRDPADAEGSAQQSDVVPYAGYVCYDVRNALSIASGSLQLAERTGMSDHYDRCQDALERIDQLVSGLLEATESGVSVNPSERIDVAELVQDAWDGADTRDALLVTKLNSLEVTADPTGLRRLLENLFENAVEHGQRDVAVTVGPLADGFYVEDDGPGIPPDVQETLFLPGVSTSDGQGVGLPVVWSIAEAHGWDVTVEDSADGGARFEVTGLTLQRPRRIES